MSDDERQQADAAWVERWRAVEPTLRRDCAWFVRSTPYTVDELLSEIAVRMLHAGMEPSSTRDFYRAAQAIGRRVVLDWLRTEARRREVRRRRAGELQTLAADLERDEARERDEFDAFEWRLALRQAMEHPALTPAQRRAVSLMLRGGPYSPAERNVLYRARDAVREIFDGMFVGVALKFSRWRERVTSPPPAFAPLVAAAATAAAIGVFPASSASVDSGAVQPSLVERSDTPTARDLAVSSPATRHLAIAPVGDRDPLSSGRPARPSRERSAEAPLVGAHATIPRGSDGGADARVAVLPNDEHWGSVPVRCESAVGRAVCAAAVVFPAPPTP
jgi:DNA-directed RNA polymerase specialized sigma24 family protein